MKYEIRIISEEDTVKSRVYEDLDLAINVAQSVYNNFVNFDFGDEIVVAEENSKDKKYLWANGKKLVEELKVGDIVKVVDRGKAYTTYVDFMTANGTKRDCCAWAYNKSIPDEDEYDNVYEIICITPHTSRPNVGNLAIIKKRDSYAYLPTTYIIQADGLKKI